MKKGLIVLLFLNVFASLYAQQKYEPGVILLTVKDPETVNFKNNQWVNGSSQLRNVFSEYTATKIRKLSHVNKETDGCYKITFPENFQLNDIRTALSECPDLSYVSLNYYGVLSADPLDTYWDAQWSWARIKIPELWDLVKPDDEILIGILDTGIDYTHEDLEDNIWENIGWDFVDDDNNPQEINTYHGTRVAGVIAAKTYNSTGIAGIAGGWQNQILHPSLPTFTSIDYSQTPLSLLPDSIG
jgi:subtilisin family serine protease